MMKALCLPIAVFLSMLFSFFNPGDMKISVDAFSFINFLAISMALILFALNQKQIKEVTLSKTEKFFSLLLGLCITISCGLVHGDEFDVFYGSFSAVMFSCAALWFYSRFSICLFRFVFYKTNEYISREKSENICPRKKVLAYIFRKVESNRFWFYFCVLVIAWSIPFIINFPGLVMFDTRYQLYMYNHIPNKYTFASVLLDKSQYITQHHSVPHTLWVGFIFNLGKSLFNSYDAGVFIYCIIQYVFIALVVSYMIKFMRSYSEIKHTVIVTAFFALHPFFPISAILVTKDVYFCGIFVLFMLNYYKLIKNPEKFGNKKFFLLFAFLSILMVVLRANALYTLIIISCGMFWFIQKKRTVAAFLGIILTFNILYTSVMLPMFDIPKASIREMMSIPLQQTARYVRKHPAEVTFQEKSTINRVVFYRGIGRRYNPQLSDPVKDGFNRYVKTQDLKKYFKTWRRMFFKHPITYVEAFIMQNYGYYCPGAKDNVTYNCISDYQARSSMRNRNIITVSAEKPNQLQMGYYYFQCFMFLSPIINLVMDSGVYIWIWFLILLALYRHTADKKYLMYYLPYFAYLLFVIAGPVNGTIYSRYIMPFVYTLPMMFLPIFEYKRTAEKTKDFQ